MTPKIIRGLLISLVQCDGVPMPESALVFAAQLLCRPGEPTVSDVLDKLRTLEAEGYLSGVTETLTNTRTWTLTTRGVHKARELR